MEVQRVGDARELKERFAHRHALKFRRWVYAIIIIYILSNVLQHISLCTMVCDTRGTDYRSLWICTA